jgi:hypothetical protein
MSTFPIFTTLIACNIARTVGLSLMIAMHADKSSYLVAYSLFAFLDLSIQLGVVYEMASHVFRPFTIWSPDVRSNLLWMSCASALIAAGLTCLSSQPPAKTWLLTQLIRGNFFSSVLMIELFVSMVVLSFTVSLPWKTHVARVSQGLGFYSIVCVLTEAGHSHFGMDHAMRLSSSLSRIRMVSYLCSLSYWTVTLWVKAPTSKELPEEMRTQLFTLQMKLEYDLRKIRTWRRE